MEQRILIFWIAVYGFVWLLRRNPRNVASRAAFTWIGPVPTPGETWASFQFRWASYSFGWLCQFAIALSGLLVAMSYFPSVGEEAWFRVAAFALPFGVGIATLAMLGFLVKAGKARWLGPNPNVGRPVGERSHAQLRIINQPIQEYLATLSWKEGETPPVVDFALYFEGNSEEECVAPNQLGAGRPPIAELYRRFQEIARRPDVDRVLIGLNSDWNDDAYLDTFPPAENVHIITASSKPEVESWLSGLHSDGVLTGWPYGKPKNAPDIINGYTVFTVCWD